MDIVFCDDARQRTPWRPGMGSLLGLGAVYVPGTEVGEVERQLEALCDATGFPPGEEFKWHPRRGSWMKEHLIADDRTAFLVSVLGILENAGCGVILVAEDETCRPAHVCDSHEMDVLTLMMERISRRFRACDCSGLVVIDDPPGGGSSRARFLAATVIQWKSCLNYVHSDSIAIAPVVTASHRIRLLQAADIVASSSLAFLAGETVFSPPLFEAIRPMLAADSGRIGGVGVKLHPDYKYANLYHWLLGDTHLWRFNYGVPYPLIGRPYAQDATSY